MGEPAAVKEARVARARLRESQAKETELIGAIINAINILDDMGLEAYDRETLAASVLEEAIGRPPRRKP